MNNSDFPVLLLVMTVWDLSWKGVALWKAARKDQKYWFVALVIVNSVGILPIIYLLLENWKNKKAMKIAAIKPAKKAKR